MTEFLIRRETPSDVAAVDAVTREAFAGRSYSSQTNTPSSETFAARVR